MSFLSLVTSDYSYHIAFEGLFCYSTWRVVAVEECSCLEPNINAQLYSIHTNYHTCHVRSIGSRLLLAGHSVDSSDVLV